MDYTLCDHYVTSLVLSFNEMMISIPDSAAGTFGIEFGTNHRYQQIENYY